MLFTPSKVIWASALAFSLTSLPLTLSVSAQTGNSDTMNSPSTATTAPSNGTSGAVPDPSNTKSGAMSSQGTDSVRDDRGFDWGWLGLFGLLGLAGLTRKSEQTQAYRDPNDASRSTSRT